MHVTRSHTRNIECHIYPLFRIMLFATVAAVAFSERAEGGEIGIATYAWWFGANEQWTHITSNNEQVIFSIYKRSMTQFTFHFVVLYLFIQSFFSVLFCSCTCNKEKKSTFLPVISCSCSCSCCEGFFPNSTHHSIFVHYQFWIWFDLHVADLMEI